MAFTKLKDISPKPEDADAVEARGDVPRDKRRWPRVWLPDGSRRVSYARPSGLGEALQDSSNLIPWSRGRVAVGALRSPDILERMRKLDHVDWESSEGKKLSRGFGEELFLAGGGETASKRGTQIHEIFEGIDHGRIPKVVPEDFRPYMNAYLEMMDRVRDEYDFQMVDTEVFGVNDELKIAGSLDLLALVTYNGKRRLVIVDKKTSQTLDYSIDKFVIQMWAYSQMSRYNPSDALNKVDAHGLGVGREPMRVMEDGVAIEVDHEVGFIQHIPSGGTEAHWVPVPLEMGKVGYDLAQEVKEWRNRWGRKANRPQALISVDKRGEIE